MSIEIESPEEFLDDYKDPKDFQKILEHIQKKRFLKKFSRLNLNPGQQNTLEAMQKAQRWLLAQTCGKPYWDAPIEANASLSAQFILMALGMQFQDKDKLEKLFQYVISKKDEKGLYPLYYGGPAHYSTNLLIYLAGRALGYSKDSGCLSTLYEYLRKTNIHTATNMETRLLLAAYGLIDWNAVPPITPLLMLIPQEADFTIYSISYWVRTSLVPMMILWTLKYQFPSFPLAPEEILDLHPEKKSFPPFEAKNRLWDGFIRNLDSLCSLNMKEMEKLAVKKAELWTLQHQDESGDWGGIYPAMQYSLMGLYASGYALDHPVMEKGMQALFRFQKDIQGKLHQQSCVSPVWDTAWSLIALYNSGIDLSSFSPHFVWLRENQIFQEGDWAVCNKTGFGGGWAFQFSNVWYPDTDDSAVVIMSMLNHPSPDAGMLQSIRTGVRWLLTMQNPDGGWSAFEQGVDDDYVDKIPFNDMENWKDPSTADVTGRCLQMLGELKVEPNLPCVRKAVAFLLKTQEKDGSWFGRWGVNHIYGTWSVIMGLKHFLPQDAPAIQKAVEWLESIQKEDGGWGESCDSYIQGCYIPLECSTASQTAWAILALIHAGKAHSPCVQKGIEWLVSHQTLDGTWEEKHFTGTGFPKHFYLRYDYYRHYFPLWALGEGLYETSSSKRVLSDEK
ncbi:MAG: squalene--hopene cyclase [Candidatus Brocadiae bacterium]|nr:squalene--hopene cyclase [Candidatus Brocadiia bacterium]